MSSRGSLCREHLTALSRFPHSFLTMPAVGTKDVINVIRIA